MLLQIIDSQPYFLSLQKRITTTVQFLAVDDLCLVFHLDPQYLCGTGCLSNYFQLKFIQFSL